MKMFVAARWNCRSRCLFMTLGFCLAALASLASAGRAAATGCPNEAFRVRFGALLPDCRAYEQVSPANKDGAPASGLQNYVIAAEEGPGLTFISANGSNIPSIGGGGADYPTYLASRGEDAWSLHGLLPPQSLGASAQFLGITPDLRYDVVQALNNNFGHPGAGQGLYLIDRSNEGEAVSVIVPPADNEEDEYAYAFDGASSDGSRVYFESRAAAAEGSIEGVSNLYVWERQTGRVTLVGVLPGAEGGEAPISGASGGAPGGGLAELAVAPLHAVSASGGQIFFTASENPAGETDQLYARRGVDGPDPETTRISRPNPGVPAPTAAAPATFQEATPAGSRVFFLSSAELTSDARTGPSEEGQDLYSWDAGTGLLTDLTPDASAATPNGAEVKGLIGAGEDGGSGFFVARGVLGDGLAEGAKAGANNLYHFETFTGRVALSFVAVLGPENLLTEWTAQTAQKAARVSADGSVVMFSSTEPLTGYQNESAECSYQGDEVVRCAEIFRYDATSRQLSCVSCGSVGTPPAGPATFQQKEMFYKFGEYPHAPAAVFFSRNLAAEGNVLFFQTPQALVSRDTNGQTECAGPKGVGHSGLHPCQDVYEWEAVGTPGGSCVTAEMNGGCVYLLSTGESNAASFFAGASRDGSNAYLLTNTPVTGSDTDLLPDFYDARIDGGLADQLRSESPGCGGESCLSASPTAPVANAPGSIQLHGAGNVEARKKKRHHRRKRHRRRQRSHARRAKSAHHSGGHGSARRAGGHGGHR